MNTIIIYYSYTGNTKRVADILAEVLGAEKIFRLQARDETDSFFQQAKRAFFHQRAEIEDSPQVLEQYDLVCLGTPVWAFGPAPAMWTYLDQCRGLQGKRVILFATYGSGLGKDRCLNLMEKLLMKKGTVEVKRFFIKQDKVMDTEFVSQEINNCLPA